MIGRIIRKILVDRRVCRPMKSSYGDGGSGQDRSPWDPQSILLAHSKTIRHHSSQQHVEITILIAQGGEFRRQHRGSIYLSLITVFFCHHYHHESNSLYFPTTKVRRILLFFYQANYLNQRFEILSFKQ